MTEGLIFHPLPTSKSFKNKEGMKFSMLSVLGFAGCKNYPGGQRFTMWHCRCDCGQLVVKATGKLKPGGDVSCGCWVIETSRKKATTHGHKSGGRMSKIYCIWVGMVQRVTKPTHCAFADYGGRGITIDPAWLKFENFLADMGERPEGMTLDRENNDLGYCKSNCRWATQKDQCRNKRSNRFIEYQGERLCLSEWAERTGISKQTIRDRLMRGRTAEKILSQK